MEGKKEKEQITVSNERKERKRTHDRHEKHDRYEKDSPVTTPGWREEADLQRGGGLWRTGSCENKRQIVVSDERRERNKTK